MIQVLLTTKLIKLIDKKKFDKATFNKNIKTFIVYVIVLNFSSILIYLAKKMQITLLLAKKI